MRFGTWNVRSTYRAGSLMTVARELSKYELELMGLVARRDNGDTIPAGEYTFFRRKGNENRELDKGVFIHKSIISPIKRVKFVNDRITYITLRVRGWDVIFLNVHAPKEVNIDDMKDSL
jgi:hypothetical protein